MTFKPNFYTQLAQPSTQLVELARVVTPRLLFTFRSLAGEPGRDSEGLGMEGHASVCSPWESRSSLLSSCGFC